MLHPGVQVQRTVSAWVHALSWAVHKAADVRKCWFCHYSEGLKGFCEAASSWLNQYDLMVTEPSSPLLCENKQPAEVLPVHVESNIVGRLYLNRQRHNVFQTSPRELIILIKGPFPQWAGFFFSSLCFTA